MPSRGTSFSGTAFLKESGHEREQTPRNRLSARDLRPRRTEGDAACLQQMRHHAFGPPGRPRNAVVDDLCRIVESASSRTVSNRSTTGDSRERSSALHKTSTTRQRLAQRSHRLPARPPRSPLSGATSPTGGETQARAGKRKRSGKEPRTGPLPTTTDNAARNNITSEKRRSRP